MPVMDGYRMREELTRDPDLARMPRLVISAGRTAPHERLPPNERWASKPLSVQQLLSLIRESLRLPQTSLAT